MARGKFLSKHNTVKHNISIAGSLLVKRYPTNHQHYPSRLDSPAPERCKA